MPTSVSSEFEDFLIICLPGLLYALWHLCSFISLRVPLPHNVIARLALAEDEIRGCHSCGSKVLKTTELLKSLFGADV